MNDAVNMDIATPEGMQNAIRWQESMLNLVRDGGIWVVPRSMSMIQVDKVAKVAIIKLGMREEPQIKAVFRAMGWAVQDRAFGTTDNYQAFSA